VTVYWVVWDAAAHWVVDRLEREGALPAVSRLRRRGTFAAARPARPNCQTPAALATLFTGSWPQEHGVTGYHVPIEGEGQADAEVGAQVSGFSPRFPAIRPVWEALEGLGMSATLLHVPWVFGAAGTVGPCVDAAAEAFSDRVVRHGVLPVRPGANRVHLWELGSHILEVCDPAPDGPVTVRTADGREVRLVPGGEWQPLNLAAADHGPGTWLGCVPAAAAAVADGAAVGDAAIDDPAAHDGLLVVHTGIWNQRFAGGDPAVLAALETAAAAHPFAGEGVGPLYRTGLFGPRLVDGGDGSAEEVFLASVECAARSFAAGARAALTAHASDLVVVYLPMTDDVGHEFLGWCDPLSAAHRPAVAAAIWEHIARCYRWADDVLAQILERATPEDTVVLGADHGMVGNAHTVHVNEHLIRAGLAARGPAGEVEPRSSGVYYHPANNGSLWAGPAASGTAADELERARKSLSELVGPDGAPVVARFLTADGRPVPPGRAVGPGPVFVALADDYQPSAAAAADGGPVVRPARKPGAHVVNTGSTRLHAVFAAAAPDIAPGSGPALVDNTYPARLVARRLDVPLPGSPTKGHLMETRMAPPTIPVAELAARRAAHVAGFLAGRGLSADWLGELMAERVGPGLLLLTSSPVHGLANATSDLDFIRIQDGPISGPRISTKIFEDGHHLEIVSFSRAEVQANLQHLIRLASDEPAMTVAGFRRWDKEREPRSKQTERIVNGMTLDGQAPFLDWLPALSTVWSRSALHSAVEQAVHLALAETAGERRGRVGYAFNTLLRLMDALLSEHGDVYTTRKWYLLRWSRLVREGTWRDARVQAIAAEVERLRAQIGRLLADSCDLADPADASDAMAPAYLALAAEVAQALDIAEQITISFQPTAPAPGHAYLPGSALLLAPAGGLPLPDRLGHAALPAGPVALTDVADQDSDTAAWLLGGLRSGAHRFEIGYTG
jgi:hypothetical protein